jgi:hypothetical protein
VERFPLSPPSSSSCRRSPSNPRHLFDLPIYGASCHQAAALSSANPRHLIHPIADTWRASILGGCHTATMGVINALLGRPDRI